jgi:ABC-type transport system substrate-binding protein
VLALDRDGLSTALGGTANMKAETVLPPGLPGYSADLPRFAFDPDQARALLAASRYAGQMPPLVLADLGAAGSPTALGAAMAEMWRTNLGLEVNLVPSQSSLRPATPEESHGHALVFTWCADYPDPENFLEVMFFSTSEFNSTSYANAQVDEWLAAARAEPDPAVRQSLFHQAETKILADVAAIPWLHPTYERLVKPHVKGFVLAPMGAPVVHLITLEWPPE